MQRICVEKNLMQQKHKQSKRAMKSDRTRCRDEKYAGRAGPLDCVEVEAETHAECVEEKETDVVETEMDRGTERDESVGGWDMVAGEEHLHSPDSSHPPCTYRTLARCTVS
jgi:hypothetical protein